MGRLPKHLEAGLQEPPRHKSRDVAEVPLDGGRLTSGIVRVGITVRRPAKPSSQFVARLLCHLESHGFRGAPRYLGVDGQSRDVLSYIDGVVPRTFRQFSDEQICRAGLLVREFHDATAGFDGLAPGGVVCHNDIGPNNVVFEADTPVALIDFDLAARGDPLEDLGYAAWTWCVSSKATRAPVAAQAAQVRILTDAYGASAAQRHRVFSSIVERQSRNVAFWAGKLDGFDGPPTTRGEIVDRVTWSEKERAFTEAHRRVFAAALR